MPTLWEILTKRKKEQKSLEMTVYNPLQAKVGCVLNVNEPNYTGKNFIVQGIRVYERKINDDQFNFVDYESVARLVNEDDQRIKIRLNPNDSGTELGCDIIVLTKYDEMSYDEEFFKNVLNSESGDITLNEENSTFWRINDVLTAYKAKTIYLADKDGNGIVEENELKKEDIRYWDYWRETADIENDVEIGPKYIEFLFIEMDKNGYFTFWRGKKVDAGNVVLF